MKTRNSRRLRQIAVFATVQTLAFRRFVRLTGENRADRLDIPRRFVGGLIELGPTFVKIGQFLSTRPDLLPEEYVAELKILHETVPGFKTDLVRDIIASELGRGVEDIFEARKLPEQQRRQLGKRLLEMGMKMFVTDGFFHADLHPGKVRFGRNGQIVLLDFGMYGELSEDHRDRFLCYWLAAVQRQTKRAFHHLVKQTNILPGANEEAYLKKFAELADAFYDSTTLRETSLTKTYLQILLSGAKVGFLFPIELVLHAKALTTAEALSFTLVPDMNFVREAKPIVIRALMDRTTDPGRLKSFLLDVVPELVLFGETPPARFRDGANGAGPSSAWGELMASVAGNLGDPALWRRKLKEYLGRAACDGLSAHYSQSGADAVLGLTWLGYADLEPTVPPQRNLGAEVTVRLAALTIALYRALLATGQSPEGATRIIRETAWREYRKMGDVPGLLAGIFSSDALTRLRLATQIFRTFPFGAPSYLWRDVEAGPDVVGFDCLKCPVAEYFASFGFSGLCASTWCDLDFPLAERWGGRLERTGSIASGAPVCDFRWVIPRADEPDPACRVPSRPT